MTVSETDRDTYEFHIEDELALTHLDDGKVLRQLVSMGGEHIAATIAVRGLSIGSVAQALRRLDLARFVRVTNRATARRYLYAATPRGEAALAWWEEKNRV